MMTSRRSFLAGAGAAALATTLAACSQDVPSVPTATGTSTPLPVLDSDRLTEALTRIHQGIKQADASKDANALASYLTGPAERVRQKEYAVATGVGDDSLVHVLPDTTQAGAVGLTKDFPRTAMTITEKDPSIGVPYLYVLDQGTARDNMRMWAWIRLFAGAKVPATATALKGSEQIDADSTGLVATPAEVLASYVDALNDPNGANGKAFTDDPVRQRVAADRAVDVTAAGSITVTASAGTDGFRGVRTTDGGAIVVTTLSFNTVYSRTVAGGTLNVAGSAASLLGDPAVRGSVTITTDVMIAFSVPAQGSGKTASALGGDLVLAAATRDDSTSPG